AEQAYDVGAVGVEAQAAVGQRARVGGEERAARLVLGLAVGPADMRALVADGAHQLARAVLEDRSAEMRAQSEVELAQLVLAVAVDREAAQFHDARAVLQLVTDVVEQFVELLKREVRARD